MTMLAIALADTSPSGTLGRIAWLEQTWANKSPEERRYWLIDVGMRLGWLAARARSVSTAALVDQATERLRALESRGI